MGESTYTRDELTIPAAAIDARSRGLDAAAGDADKALVECLTELVTENAYEPIATHRTEGGLHVELYGDYHSTELENTLAAPARPAASGSPTTACGATP